MALLFKNIKWYEWVLIGVILLGSVGAYLLLNRYDQLRDVVAQANADNTVLVDIGNYKDQSAAITDQVVTGFVQQQSDVQEQQQQSRYGVIDEYVNMAGQSGVRFPEPTEVVTGPTERFVQRPAKKIEVTPARSRDSDVAIAARLSVLAAGMHKHYCAAAPERGHGCVANSSKN